MRWSAKIPRGINPISSQTSIVCRGYSNKNLSRNAITQIGGFQNILSLSQFIKFPEVGLGIQTTVKVIDFGVI